MPVTRCIVLGRIVTSEGVLLPNVSVRLTPIFGVTGDEATTILPAVVEVLTDDNAEFSAALVPGRYTVAVLDPPPGWRGTFQIDVPPRPAAVMERIRVGAITPGTATVLLFGGGAAEVGGSPISDDGALLRYGNRTDTLANWVAQNPLLAVGEEGYVADENGAPVAHKIGPGYWNDLEFYSSGEGGGGDPLLASRVTTLEDEVAQVSGSVGTVTIAATQAALDAQAAQASAAAAQAAAEAGTSLPPGSAGIVLAVDGALVADPLLQADLEQKLGADQLPAAIQTATGDPETDSVVTTGPTGLGAVETVTATGIVNRWVWFNEAGAAAFPTIPEARDILQPWTDLPAELYRQTGDPATDSVVTLTGQGELGAREILDFTGTSDRWVRFGSTGEITFPTDDEARALLQRTVAYDGGSVPLLASDNGAHIRLTHAAPVLSIIDQATGVYADNFAVTISSPNSITIARPAGVTLTVPGLGNVTSAVVPFGMGQAQLRRIGTDIWEVYHPALSRIVTRRWMEAMPTVVLTPGPVVAPDFAAGVDFRLTPNQNFLLGNPSNQVENQRREIAIVQPSTPRQMELGSQYRLVGSVAGLTQTAGAVDWVRLKVETPGVRVFCEIKPALGAPSRAVPFFVAAGGSGTGNAITSFVDGAQTAAEDYYICVDTSSVGVVPALISGWTSLLTIVEGTIGMRVQGIVAPTDNFAVAANSGSRRGVLVFRDVDPSQPLALTATSTDVKAIASGASTTNMHVPALPAFTASHVVVGGTRRVGTGQSPMAAPFVVPERWAGSVGNAELRMSDTAAALPAFDQLDIPTSGSSAWIAWALALQGRLQS